MNEILEWLDNSHIQFVHEFHVEEVYSNRRTYETEFWFCATFYFEKAQDAMLFKLTWQ